MGTKKGVAIGAVAGVAISIIAVYALFASSGFSTKIAASDETTTTETDAPKRTTTTITRTTDGQKPSERVSGFPDSDPGELVTIYENCRTSMLTDPGRPRQAADVKCYDGSSSQYIPSTTFKFNAPAALQDSGTMCFTCKSKVYQYENGFELAFTDQVSEKRYPVTLKELPH